MPASALGGASTPKATTADKLDPLPSDKMPKPKLDAPAGDFSNPPPAHVDQAKTPEKGKSSFDPVNSKVIERSDKVTTYENPDGSRTSKVSQDDINAQDNGTWREIDSNVSKKSDGRLHNGFGKADVSLADSADDDNVAQVKKDDKSLGFSLVGAKSGKRAASDKTT
jgi:hypothetical protein